MIRSLSMLTLATILLGACSQSSPPPPAAGKEAPATPAAGGNAPAVPPQSAEPPAKADTPPAQAPHTAATTGESQPRPAPIAPPKPAPSQPIATPSEAGATPSEPVAAPVPAPTVRDLTIPAGTSLSVKVLDTLASNTSAIEDPVRGSLAKSIVIAGSTVAPAGAEITGLVTDAKESGRVKGRATIAFRFDRLKVRGKTYRIETAPVTREAAQNKGSDVRKGGVGAGLGAVVGGVVGGGKGAALGAAAGGAGAVLGTKGDEVQVEPGTVVTALLQTPVTVSVPNK